MKHKIIKKVDATEEDKLFPLPVYKAEDDIYNREEKESLEDEESSVKNEPGYNDHDPGRYLDVPGTELDDVNEVIGEEDEENNYYSLGGDRHEPENYTTPESV